MENCTIAFIGCGNMARSLIGGLIANDIDKSRLIAADPDAGQRQKIKDQFAIETLSDNSAAIEQADVVLLAVKPQVMQEVIKNIAADLAGKGKLLISIAAGIGVESMQSWLGSNEAIIRAMPNTPAMIQAGAAALYANKAATEAQKHIAESMLRSVGTAVWLEDESLMDSVTALSGSGPAYFFYFMEAMEKAAIELGMEEEMARLLTIETAVGAAKMALMSTHDPATLRQQVTSPGGTTEQALNIFNKNALDEIISKAMQAAKQRSIEMSEGLSQ